MTVNELIEKLKKYPGESDVKIYACGNGAQEVYYVDDYWRYDCDGIKHTTVYVNGEDYI